MNSSNDDLAGSGVSTDLQDLIDRLRPLVEQALVEALIASTPVQLDRLVRRLAEELRRDLGIV